MIHQIEFSDMMKYLKNKLCSDFPLKLVVKSAKEILQPTFAGEVKKHIPLSKYFVKIQWDCS